MQHPNLEIIYYRFKGWFWLTWNKDVVSYQTVWLVWVFVCLIDLNLNKQNFKRQNENILACCEVIGFLFFFFPPTA